MKGPCGTPCRECPERDECEQDCNVEDKKEEASEKDEVVCSSSKKKVALGKNFIDDNADWQKQPLDMFPTELENASSAESIALSKPMMIVDSTEFQGAGTWFKPTSLEDLLVLLKDFGGEGGGGYKIVVGNTEVGIGKKTHAGRFWNVATLNMPFSFQKRSSNVLCTLDSSSQAIASVNCTSSLYLQTKSSSARVHH